MPCCKTTDTWAKNLRTNAIGAEYKQYAVQLTRDIGCVTEKYHIFVNGVEIEHHALSYNPCSPLCCSGGIYEWEQDGHSFMLIYNNLSFTRAWGGFRLFIDGVDVNTGRDIKSYWQRRGIQVIFMGACFILLGIILSLIFHYALEFKGGAYAAGYGLVITGLVYCVTGVIACLRKFPEPRYNAFTDASYSSQDQRGVNVVWNTDCQHS